ncbi:MAG: isocitrate/isopropylmalate dehydrogenase family protein [Candidatus Omnitrophota bacterium]
MKKYKVTLIPGDGIGPELADAARRCVDATGAGIEWEILDAGECVIAKHGEPLPDHVIESIRKNKVAIKGPITTPVGSGFRSINVSLRKSLDLFACLRPCKSYRGVHSRYENVDLVIVRENTEDLYAGIEFDEGTEEAKSLIPYLEKLSSIRIQKDSAISIKPISKTASERVIRFAFEYAVTNRRKKVTAVHKANIMKFTDGLFLKAGRKVAEEYKGRVEFEDRIVDTMCMQLVRSPKQFDVIVLPNLYGDIVSDLAAGLVGGLGVAPGANIGDDIAVFEPTHGSAPKYKGMNKVNPTAILLSAVMMLRYLGEIERAVTLESAIAQVIADGKSVTYDFKSDRNDPSAVGTREMTDAIIDRIRAAK